MVVACDWCVRVAFVRLATCSTSKLLAHDPRSMSIGASGQRVCAQKGELQRGMAKRKVQRKEARSTRCAMARTARAAHGHTYS